MYRQSDGIEEDKALADLIYDLIDESNTTDGPYHQKTESINHLNEEIYPN